MPGLNVAPKSGYSGHGRSQPRQRYAWPNPLKRSHSRSDAAYLKTWGSRPARKRPQQLERAA
jgi:hypothetical protein